MILSKDQPPLSREEQERLADLWASEILAEVEKHWNQAATELEPIIEAATLSGVAKGFLQLEITDAGLINETNAIARDFAKKRAAELVGKKWVDGQLVDNPDAEWAISETTRDKIRTIVAESFQQETPIEEIRAAIQTALEAEKEGGGIFSDARAKMIADTEVMHAEVGGNYLSWVKSGVVTKVKWLVSNLTPCDECAAVANEETELGKPFSNEVLHPPAHPNCRCVLIASGFEK
jgi:hypothetical protein